MTALRALLFAAVSCLVSPIAGAQGGGLQLRPVDRATVRIVSMRGVESGADRVGQPRLSLSAAHGSGVVVSREGFIATAAHVVDDADYLVVIRPGQERGSPAHVVYRDPARDLAIIQGGGGYETAVPIGSQSPLRLGQTVNASGYPLDPRERWPAAASGQVGRPMNDGRVQLSISLNPGNSGGPIVTSDGTLVGIVSQGADPQRGAQGLTIMELIGSLAAPLRQVMQQRHASLPQHEPASDVLLELIDARDAPTAELRLLRLAQAQSDNPAVAAMMTVEAHHLQRNIMEAASAQYPSQLVGAARRGYDEAEGAARRWAALARQAGSAANYGALATVQSNRGAVAASPLSNVPPENLSVSGPATGHSPFAPSATRSEDRPPIVTVAFSGLLGMHVDNSRNADAVSGVEVGLNAALRLGLVYTDIIRWRLVGGVEFSIGGWRGSEAGIVLGQLGTRLEFGELSTAFFFEGVWGLGYVGGERLAYATGLSYRGSAGVRIDMLEVGISYREVGRGADSTLRTLSVFAGIELGE